MFICTLNYFWMFWHFVILLIRPNKWTWMKKKHKKWNGVDKSEDLMTSRIFIFSGVTHHSKNVLVENGSFEYRYPYRYHTKGMSYAKSIMGQCEFNGSFTTDDTAVCIVYWDTDRQRGPWYCESLTRLVEVSVTYMSTCAIVATDIPNIN